MLKVTEIAFTCHPVTDMARARNFYEAVPASKPAYHSGQPGGMERVESDIAHGTPSLGAGTPDWHPRSDGCAAGLEVEDFDAAITHRRENGVRFKMEPFPTPICRMAFILDPDDNTICNHKRNPGHR